MICRKEWTNTRMYSETCDCSHCTDRKAVAARFAYRDTEEYQQAFERDLEDDDYDED